MDFIDLISGKSHHGDEIKSYKSTSKNNKYIYLIAGVHGDEVEGVYVLQQLFQYLKEEETLELPLVVIPVLNVDGLRTGTRLNAKGVDLNRNLPSKSWSHDIIEPKYHPGEKALSEPENIYLDKLFKKLKPKLIISFHSWKPIINYNGNCKELAELLAKNNNYIISDDIGYSTPGSLGDYAPEKYNAPVITFECPLLSEEVSLKDIWEENKKALIDLIHSDIVKNW